MALEEHGRFQYSAIVDRRSFYWPGGRSLALYVAVAIEHFPYGEGGLGLSYSPGIPQPNTYNWAWREYGNRIGGFRLLEALEATRIPPTVLLNTAAYEHCPELVAAYRAAGAEFVGHGVTNVVHPNDQDEDDERRTLTAVRSAITAAEGTPPGGWMSPGANPSRRTEDLLAECGYLYTLDWPHDEQPHWMATEGGPLLCVPYPHELNDVPAIALHDMTGAEFAEMIVAGVEELYEQSSRLPLVCGIVVHTFIAGQPHRLRPLRAAFAHLADLGEGLWLTTPGQIAAAFAKQIPAPGS